MKKTVVIIGSNKGIGLEFVKQYLELEYRVVALCRTSSPELDELDCEVVEGIDVADDELINEIAQKINVEFIDILIHNSGILVSDNIDSISFDNMRSHFEINTLGTLKTVLGLQSKFKAGTKVGIVTSRVGSIEDNSSSNNYAYRVSKTAANMVGKCLSIDLHPQGVAVALLHPGYVRTQMTNNSGLIDADEAAAGLIQRMDELSLDTTGCFVHSSGEALPW